MLSTKRLSFGICPYGRVFSAIVQSAQLAVLTTFMQEHNPRIHVSHCLATSLHGSFQLKRWEAYNSVGSKIDTWVPLYSHSHAAGAGEWCRQKPRTKQTGCRLHEPWVLPLILPRQGGMKGLRGVWPCVLQHS
eukprot:361800-Chlamydomonas_euryale.AAC.4